MSKNLSSRMAAADESRHLFMRRLGGQIQKGHNIILTSFVSVQPMVNIYSFGMRNDHKR